MTRQKLENLSLKSKIQTLIFCCILVIASTCFISIHYITKAYKNVLYQSLAQTLAHSASELSEQLDILDTAADLIFSNRTIQTHLVNYKYSTLKAEKQQNRHKIYTALCDYIYNSGDNNISYVSFYQDQDQICTSNSLEAKIPDQVRDDLIKRARKAGGSTVWITDYSESYGLFLVKELREIEGLSLDSLGVMIMKVDMEKLITSTTASDPTYENGSYLLFNQDMPVYYSPTVTREDAKILKSQLDSDYKIISIDDNDFFAVHGVLRPYGWEYICAVSYSSIADTTQATIRFSLLAMAVCILLVIFLSTKILSSVTVHFDLLIQKMRRFGSGCYKRTDNHYDYSHRKDEIGLLHTNFDSMAQKVDTLIEENYVNELLKKEAQIKSMESQMDPHFLYNTLDSINWRAKAMGAEDISQITTSLGNLLRVTLSKKNNIFTIREELCVLENYTTIQKLRYQKRLQYCLDIPEELLDCEIPKLTIQPLLENAVRYGLEEISETCFISVCAQDQGETITIEVKNNGSYFEEGLLDKLLSQEILPHGLGIGIINIHKRLQLTYGSQYGLRFYNMEDDLTGEEYAIAQVIMPKRKIE